MSYHVKFWEGSHVPCARSFVAQSQAIFWLMGKGLEEFIREAYFYGIVERLFIAMGNHRYHGLEIYK